MHPSRPEETGIHIATPLVPRVNVLEAGRWHLDEIESMLNAGPVSLLESQLIQSQANFVQHLSRHLQVLPDQHRERLLARTAIDWDLDLRERIISVMWDDCVRGFQAGQRLAVDCGDWHQYVQMLRRPFELRGVLAILWMARKSFRVGARLAIHAARKIRLLNESS